MIYIFNNYLFSKNAQWTVYACYTSQDKVFFPNYIHWYNVQFLQCNIFYIVLLLDLLHTHHNIHMILYNQNSLIQMPHNLHNLNMMLHKILQQTGQLNKWPKIRKKKFDMQISLINEKDTGSPKITKGISAKFQNNIQAPFIC